MDNQPFDRRAAAIRVTIAVIGGALLGGSLAGLIALVAMSCGADIGTNALAVWAGIGAACGAIQAGSHVGLHLHREWLEANNPHDHDDLE
jgi:hypothetical protein